MKPLSWTMHVWVDRDIRTLVVINTDTGVTASKDFTGSFGLEISHWPIGLQWQYIEAIVDGMTMDVMTAEAVF